MNTIEKKVAITTYYTYADSKFAWVSAEHYEDKDSATNACLESMKEKLDNGFKLTPQVIVRVDYQKVYDHFMVISEQKIMTSVELISKDYYNTLEYLKEDGQ